MDLTIAIIQIIMSIVSLWVAGVLIQEWLETNKRGEK
ncbi:hypothetical protein Goe1_c00060 [Bacillus phage vB_BsuP-Goe1]|uniref:Uncharacterized protein n=1 Tax=Bacillus phage vB_BsuP-Goe1 TaxID=1807511 RepID=A0A142IG81_9CAUD|nr:hypothetical protein H3024_gp21 [Bacillus phage vB_BsuP-Goe1]AMR58236.1 hypothetical protein Goe1_c00060 [Bacillus phage vB_BsuP-Goe1]